MKAITIRQPWAWAIAAGHKRIENRPWNLHYRGPLAIHAGGGRQDLQHGTEFIYGQGITVPDDLAFMAVIAVVDLVDVIQIGPAYGKDPAADAIAAIQPEQRPYAFGPFCFLLENVRRLETPTEMPGALSLWDLDDSLIAGSNLARSPQAEQGLGIG